MIEENEPIRGNGQERKEAIQNEIANAKGAFKGYEDSMQEMQQQKKENHEKIQQLEN